MSGNRTVVVSSPAKINLGIEILGKRADGYHEIRTILATIDLVDTIHITLVPNRIETRITGVPGVLQADNLIKKAVDAFEEETSLRCGCDINVHKRIPSPGGLGGASSNAASTLMALNATHGTPLPTERMVALAAKLGSDVPFFIGPPVALASGTGTELEPLPALRSWAILIVPHVDIAAKTSMLYGLLRADDFTMGTRIDHAKRALQNHILPSPDLLANAFARPLYESQPKLAELARTVLKAGAPHINLSGAGPGHYVLLETEQEARSLARKLNPLLPEDVLLSVVTTHSAPTSVELLGP